MIRFPAFSLIFFFFALLSTGAFAQKWNTVNHVSMDTLSWEKMSDKIYRKYVYGANGMLAYFRLEKGAFIPTHQHPNEQVTHILSGKVDVVIEGRKYTVGKGEVLIIPPNVPHSFTALEDTIDLDFFSPVRMDWINKTDTYLKQ